MRKKGFTDVFSMAIMSSDDDGNVMMQTTFLLSLARLNEMQMLSFSLSMRNVNSPAAAVTSHRSVWMRRIGRVSLFPCHKPISRLSKYLQIIQFNGSTARARQVNFELANWMQIAQLYGSNFNEWRFRKINNLRRASVVDRQH